MRAFIKNLILFLIINIPLYFLFLILFGEVMPSFVNKNLKYKRGGIGFMDKRIEDLSLIKDIDILFIGSSHSYRGYDPRIFKDFGYSTFNLGSSAQTPLTTKYLLDRYLKELNPKCVLLDVYPFLLENNGVESILNIVSNSDVNNELFKLTTNLNNIQVYNTLSYKIYKEVIGDMKITKTKVPIEDTYIGNGFVESYKVFKRDSTMDIKTKRIELKSNQLDKLDEIIYLLKENNIDYYLIQSPISISLYNSFKNNSEIDSILNTKGKYINYNEVLEYEDRLFIDDNHLNQNGVNLFNRQIIKDLKLTKKK